MTLPPVYRPSCISDSQWDAIVSYHARLDRAMQHLDFQQVIGTAKELAECVAKVIVNTSGATFGSNIDFPEAINRAHVLIDRQPGMGLANDPPIRDIAQAVKKAVLAVGTLRNSHGTGHGRPEPVVVVAEHAEMVALAAIMWSSWALRRLDHVVNGSAVDIVRDLLGGESFSRGQLRRRLEAAVTKAMDPQDLERLGVAVGQRASRGTFNVLNDGMASEFARTAPEAYRTGAVEGSFLDPEGYVRCTESSVRAALDLVGSLPEDVARQVLSRLVKTALDAERSYALRPKDQKSAADVIRSHPLSKHPAYAPLLELLADEVWSPQLTGDTDDGFDEPEAH